MESKRFYRVCNPESEQGLWYNFKGNFTGLIHDKFSFCRSTSLEMPFDEELIGYLSATDSLLRLMDWFNVEEIRKLQEFGWYIHVYETDDYKFYERFQHPVISQTNSKIISKIILE